jgi:hypothetical protein
MQLRVFIISQLHVPLIQKTNTSHHLSIILQSNYAPQTKILEGLTNISERLFEALFKGVSTGFGHKTLKSASKRRISSLVHPSKIFVWGA